MTEHDLITIVRAQFDGWNTKNFDKIVHALSDDYVFESDTIPNAVRGKDALKLFAKQQFAAFPDLDFKINEIMATGDHVVATWTATGTHRGDFNGLAPTGRRGRVNGCTIYRFKNAKITRSQAFWDAATLLRQLGALPAALEAGRERTTDREVDLRPSA